MWPFRRPPVLQILNQVGSTFENISTIGGASDGVSVVGGRGNKFKGCVAEGSGQDGFSIASDDNSFEDCQAIGSRRHGFNVKNLRARNAIPAGISDADIRDIAIRLHGLPRAAWEDELSRTGVGRWARENGVGLASLALQLVALAGSFMS